MILLRLFLAFVCFCGGMVVAAAWFHTHFLGTLVFGIVAATLVMMITK